jgi:hypothetical protein
MVHLVNVSDSIFDQVMKGIFYSFSLSILLALCTHEYSYALKVITAGYTENVHQESSFISHNSQSENLYFDDYLIEIDDDDMNDYVMNNFSFGKTAFKTISFVSHNFSDNFLKTLCTTGYLFYTHPSHFISLRVLKL